MNGGFGEVPVSDIAIGMFPSLHILLFLLSIVRSLSETV